MQSSIAVLAKRLDQGTPPVAPVQSASSTNAAGGLLAAGTYYYVVTVITATGESLVSNERSQITTGATSKNTISWAAVAGAISYRVYRGTGSLAQDTYYDVGNVLSFVDLGPSGKAARLSALPLWSTGALPVITVVGSSTGGTLPAGTYYYKVTARNGNANQESLPSLEGSVVLTGTTSSVTITITNAGGLPSVTSFNIYRGTTPGGENVQYNTSNTAYVDTGAAGTTASPPVTGAPATPGTITPTPSGTGGALPAGTYYYKVTALNAQGESLASAECTATVSGSTSSIALAGSAVSGATSYRIYRGTAAGLETLYQVQASGGALAFTDTGSAGQAGAPSPAIVTQALPRCAGGILLQQGRLFLTTAQATAAGYDTSHSLEARTMHLTLNSIELALVARGLGRYPDGSIRSVYLEADPGVDMTAGLTGTLTFNTTARVPADLTATVLDMTARSDGTLRGFSDANDLPRGGDTYNGWMQQPSSSGRHACMLLASDPAYVAPLMFTAPRDSGSAGSGAVGSAANWKALGSASTPPQFGGRTWAQNIGTDVARFDTYLKTGASSQWDKAGNYGRAQAKSTATTYWDGTYGSDLANPANIPTPGGGIATPGYYALRYFRGGNSLSGKDFHYYDGAMCQYNEHGGSCDIEYLRRAHALAWDTRYYKRWLVGDLGSGNVVTSFSEQSALITPEGYAMHYLLTGDPESLYAVERVVRQQGDITQIFKQEYYMGEPRPSGRVGIAIVWAWACTRPTAEGTPGVAGVETENWQTQVDLYVTAALSNNGRVAGTYRNAKTTQYPEGGTQYCGASPANTFVTPFQHTIILHAFWNLYYRATLSPTQKANLRTAMFGVLDALYPAYFRGDGDLLTGGFGPRLAGFLDADSGSGANFGAACLVNSGYVPGVSNGIAIYTDTANLFAAQYAAGARMAWDAGLFTKAREYRAIAERLAVNAVGDGVHTDGGLGPDVEEGANTSYKVHKEQFIYNRQKFYHLACGPAATAANITTDTCASLSISQSSASGSPGGTLTLSAVARNSAHFPTGAAVVWSSTNAAVATVNPSSGVVSYVAPGSCTIVATEPVSGLSVNCTVSVVAAQLTERWVNLTGWTPFTSGGGTAPSVSGGAATLANVGGGVSRLRSVAAYSLLTAASLSSGWIFDRRSISGVRGTIGIFDGTGKGFGLQQESGVEWLGRYTASAFGQTSSLGATNANYRWIRFKKVGTDIEVAVAPDSSGAPGTFSVVGSISISTEDLTTLTADLQADSSSTTTSMVLGHVDFP